jgi:hypothetical protein
MPPMTVIQDHVHRPVVDAEGGKRRDAEFLQEDHRTDHGRCRCRDDKHNHACAVDVDAVGLRRGLVVADRLQRKSVAGAQKKHDHADHGDGQCEENPVDQSFTGAA